MIFCKVIFFWSFRMSANIKNNKRNASKTKNESWCVFFIANHHKIQSNSYNFKASAILKQKLRLKKSKWPPPTAFNPMRKPLIVLFYHFILIKGRARKVLRVREWMINKTWSYQIYSTAKRLKKKVVNFSSSNEIAFWNNAKRSIRIPFLWKYLF